MCSIRQRVCRSRLSDIQIQHLYSVPEESLQGLAMKFGLISKTSPIPSYGKHIQHSNRILIPHGELYNCTIPKLRPIHPSGILRWLPGQSRYPSFKDRAVCHSHHATFNRKCSIILLTPSKSRIPYLIKIKRWGFNPTSRSQKVVPIDSKHEAIVHHSIHPRVDLAAAPVS